MKLTHGKGYAINQKKLYVRYLLLSNFLIICFLNKEKYLGYLHVPCVYGETCFSCYRDICVG